MTLQFEDESGADLGFELQPTAEMVINAALEDLECPYEAQVSLLVTDNEAIHDMNLHFRGVDAPTDVLSFPLLEFERPGDFSSVDEDDPDTFDPDTGELLLGDIVISSDKVLTQAGQYGHSVRREFAFLIAHSMLHLAGYDHMSQSEADVMEKKQEDILQSLGITREQVPND